MAGERTMWLAWNPRVFRSYIAETEQYAREHILSREWSAWADAVAAGWRCSQITVKDAADGR